MQELFFCELKHLEVQVIIRLIQQVCLVTMYSEKQLKSVSPKKCHIKPTFIKVRLILTIDRGLCLLGQHETVTSKTAS